MSIEDLQNAKKQIDENFEQMTKKAQENNTDRGWLPAPYYVVVEPTQDPNNPGKTIQGNDYQNSLNRYRQVTHSTGVHDSVEALTTNMTPTIKLNQNKNGLVLSGTKTALESEMANELRKYLKDAFKYADLQSENVATAIQEINTDLKSQINKSIVESIGGDYNKYKDYLNARETMQRQNPMDVTNSEKYGIWGYDKDGKPARKTPKEWIDYWRENYTAEERAALFAFSKGLMDGTTTDADRSVLMDFYLYTPYLVMSGGEGGDTPVYGFDGWDQFMAAIKSFTNEVNKFGEWTSNLISGPAQFFGNFGNYLKQDHLKSIANDIKLGDDYDLSKAPWMSEEDYNNKIQSILDKPIDALDSQEKTLVAFALNDALEYTRDIKPILEAGDKTVRDLADKLSYNSYKETRERMSTTENYEQEWEDYRRSLPFDWANLQDEVDAAKVYAPVSVGLGAFPGVLLRMFGESLLISSLSGGRLNISNLGDETADAITQLFTLANPTGGLAGAMTSPAGRFILTLATEIPEDIVQTAIDNTLTGHADENAELLTLGSIAENTLQNLIFRIVFGVGEKTLDWVSMRAQFKRWASQVPELKDLDLDLIHDEVNMAKEALKDNRLRFNEEGYAVVTDENGNERVLENVKGSMFNGTGDPAADAVGERYREIQNNREELRRNYYTGPQYTPDYIGANPVGEVDLSNTPINYSGVYNVTIVPANNPYAGFKSPEIRLWSTTNDGTYTVAVPRLAYRSEPIEPIYHLDMTKLLGSEDAGRKAEMLGAFELGMRIAVTGAPVDPGTAGSLAEKGDSSLSGTFLRWANRFKNKNFESLWDIKKDVTHAAKTGDNINEIREFIRKRIKERLVKPLTDRLVEVDHWLNKYRVGYAGERVWNGYVEERDLLTNILGRLTDETNEEVREELVDVILDYLAGGKSNNTRKLLTAIRNIDINKAESIAIANDIHNRGVELANDVSVLGLVNGNLVTTVGDLSHEEFPNAKIIHVPEGTKIGKAPFPETYGDVYYIDATAGYKTKNGEIYINTPDGRPHTPVLSDFNPDDWAIKENGNSNYQKFGNEYLIPVGKSRSKASDWFYQLVKGGGSEQFSPNVTSERLRSPAEMGKLLETTPLTIIEKIAHDTEMRSDPSLGSDRVLYPLSRTISNNSDGIGLAKNTDFDSFFKSMSFWIQAFNDAPTSASRWADPDNRWANHIINLYLSPEAAKWSKTQRGQQFINGLKNILTYAEGEYSGMGGMTTRFTTMPDEVRENISKMLFELAMEHQNDFSALPAAYQAIKNYKYAAPYKAKKPFTVMRGMRLEGNSIGQNSTERSLLDYKVGDDWDDAGYAFTSLAPSTANGYAGYSGDIGNYPSGRVMVRYTVPKGMPIIWYGNTKHFGEYVGQADGGAIVLPRNWPGKVAKVTHTSIGTVIDVSLADPSGNFPGIVTPKSMIIDKLGDGKYKGKKLVSALDSIFGKGYGDVVVSSMIGDGTGKYKTENDIDLDAVKKFLGTKEAQSVNKALLDSIDDSPLVLFRGQIENNANGSYMPDANIPENVSNVLSSNNATKYGFKPAYVHQYVGEAGFSFTENPTKAQTFGRNLIRMEVDRKYVLNIPQTEIARNSLSVDKTASQIALAAGKPIISYVDLDGSVLYKYVPGVNEEFDRSVALKALDSETTITPQANEAAADMGAVAQHAADTMPYDKTPTEIVDDLYKRMPSDSIEGAPDSSSPKWETPYVEKSYYKEGRSVEDTVRYAVADMPKDPTEINNWHRNALSSVVEAFRSNFIPEFEAKYRTPEDQQAFVRNMDYLFHLQKHQHTPLVNAIGMEYEVDGVKYKVTLEDVQFYKNFVDPQMKALREISKAALGVETPTTLGYLPHTDYSPENMTVEEMIEQGVLWRHYTGASAMDDGNFTTAGLSDDISERYRIFANNMLWDAVGDRLAAAKLMEEFHADGVKITPEGAMEIIKARKASADAVEKSAGAKSLSKNLKSRKSDIDWNAINDDIEGSAKNLGPANAIKKGYGNIYGQARGVYGEPSRPRTISWSDWLRGMKTPDGSLYDNGGRMIVAGDADAKFIAKRVFEENLDGNQTKDLLVEYLMQNNRRTKKGAEYIAEKWMKKILERSGNKPVSENALAAELQWMIRYEGISRLNRWVARADLNNFSKTNIGVLDSFIYRQGVLSRHISDSTVMNGINWAANKAISLRAKSLFWFNFKNGVLQLSECWRLFTEFNLGDASATIKRLATDADFRAEVDEWVSMIVPEKYTDAITKEGRSKMLEGTAEAMDSIASKSKHKNGVLHVAEMTKEELSNTAKAFDKFASSPIDFGENTKNRVLMAGVLQEAQRKGLTGNDLFNFVNKKFERIGIAANDMGKLTASDNPFFRIATNLKSFGIREANMYLNNIHDLNSDEGAGAAINYILKNLGWKAGLLVIMSKLGYGALSVLGLDPFGVMDEEYTGVDEEDYNALDRVVTNPITHAMLSGGFTSFISQLYWASRQAYESKLPLEKKTERGLDEARGVFEFDDIPFDEIRKIGLGFIPGYTQGQRVLTMADLMNRGWSVGMTGMKKYEAPDNPMDIATGFVFGPSNTPNARAYNQTPDYLQGLIENGLPGVAQQWNREWGGYREFDAINQDYSDWFNGTAADEQQWRSGYYSFKKRMRQITQDYSDALAKAYTDSEKDKLRQSYNEQLNELGTQLNLFTEAYTKRHPNGIDEEKMNNLLNILNTYQNIPGETPEDAEERSLSEWNKALERYAQMGLPQITTYQGNSQSEIDNGGERTDVVYSPQVRAALQGQFGLPEEAARQIKALYKDKWKDLNRQYRDRLFSTKGSKAKKAIQEEYIALVRQDLDPIVRLYGVNMFSNEDVENIIDDVFNSMVPKYGQTAKSYLKEVYEDYHGEATTPERGNETIKKIRSLLDSGKTAQGKALARALLQRVQESRAFINRAELEWLQGILND